MTTYPSIHFKDNSNSLPTYVFLHGLGQDLSCWNSLWNQLSAHFHCIALDLPGHGQTPSCEPLDIPTMAESVNQFLSNYTKQPLSLLGFSMGGQVALHMVSQAPELYENLILCNTGPSVLPEHQALLASRLKYIQEHTQEELVFFALANSLYGTVHPSEQLKHQTLKTMENLNKQSYYDCTKSIFEIDLLPLAQNIGHKTLILSGQYDKVTPTVLSEKLHQALVHSQLKVLPGGHLIPLEMPSEFLQALVNF